MKGWQFMRRSEIDTHRWDDCVTNASNGRLYGHSVFLDHMSDCWDAIVWGDYQAVLPLPHRQKLGVSYVYPMPFAGPLAVYGSPPTGYDTLSFLEAIPPHFWLWDMNLEVKGRSIPWPGKDRCNHTLSLRSPYPDIFSNYRASLRSALRKEPEPGAYACAGIPIRPLLAKAGRLGTLKGTKPRDWRRLAQLYEELRKMEQAFTIGWMKDGRLVAGALFFRSPGRIYYMAAWSDARGRKCQAAARMLDRVVQEYASQECVLDFEGSDLPGVAFFFDGFGAQHETYRFFRRWRLPCLVSTWASK